MKFKKSFFVVLATSVIFHTTAVFAEEREYNDAQKAFLEEVYDHIKDRDEHFTINFESNQETWDLDDIYYVLTSIDSPTTADDYDYLRGNIDVIECKYSTNGFLMDKYMFDFTWIEDKEQTKWVNDEIDKIIEKNNLRSKSDYEKILFVHDYIIDNVSYDYSEEYFSAYEGLYYGKTVCKGYALLTYKMLTELDVPCRYLVGVYNEGGDDGQGQNHAWNMVKLGSSWYYLDTTWDDNCYEKSGMEEYKYAYFLKGSNNFDREHEPDDIENGENFLDLYNISLVDYNKNLGSGAYVDVTDSDSDIAMTPYEFFKRKGDGTISSSSAVKEFISRGLDFITGNLLEISIVTIVMIFVIKLRKKKN